jgi:hypothetical protein
MPQPRKRTTPRPQSAWVYYAGADVYSWSEQLDDAIPLQLADLSAEGYVEVDLQSPTQLAALKGQLAQIVTVGSTARLSLWSPSVAVEQVERHPVVLTFHAHLPRPAGEEALPVLQQVPPPALGECALIWDGHAWQLMDHQDLGPTGITLKMRLAEAIVEMVSPVGEWWTVDAAQAALADDTRREGIEEHLAELATLTRRRKQSPNRWEAHWQRNWLKPIGCNHGKKRAWPSSTPKRRPCASQPTP